MINTIKNTVWVAVVLAAVLLVAVLLAPLPVLAQSEPEAIDVMSSPVSFANVLGLVGSLVFVIAAILLVGWLYARMRGLNVRAGNAINILAAQPLGAKEKIVIVEIGDKQIAVGVTPSSLQALHVFDKPVISAADMEFVTPFADKLRGALGRVGSR